jgi:hypothetical protein
MCTKIDAMMIMLYMTLILQIQCALGIITWVASYRSFNGSIGSIEESLLFSGRKYLLRLTAEGGGRDHTDRLHKSGVYPIISTEYDLRRPDDHVVWGEPFYNSSAWFIPLHSIRPTVSYVKVKSLSPLNIADLNSVKSRFMYVRFSDFVIADCVSSLNSTFMSIPTFNDRSPLWISLINSTSTLLLSGNEFQTTCSFKVNISSVPPLSGPNYCSGGLGNNLIFNVLSYHGGGLLVASSAGLILGDSPYGPSNWKVVSGECVSYINPKGSFKVYFDNSVIETFSATIQPRNAAPLKVIAFHSLNNEAYEVIDSSGNGLGAALGFSNPSLIVAVSSINRNGNDEFLAVVQASGSTLKLAAFYSNSWEIRFSFPSSLPSSGIISTRYVSSVSIPIADTPVIINGITTASDFTWSTFIWGK